MIKERAWPAKAMYILIAAALAMSLIIMAVPAHKVSAAAEVEAKWTRVSTPTTEDWVLAPNSIIIDYALADGGDVAYAVVNGTDPKEGAGYWLLKSTNGAATWKNITDALEKVRATETIDELLLVATDWVEADFVAVALEENSLVRVYVSKDGGTTFKDAGEVRDTVYFDDPDEVSDLIVSYEADGDRDIAICGRENTNAAALFRCTVTGDLASPWEDATDATATNYPGWDDTGETSAFTSEFVTDIIFSPSWETDRTILAVTLDVSWGTPIAYGDVYLQSGTWGETSGAWNKAGGFADAVPVLENEWIATDMYEDDPRGIAGVAVPSDYSGDSITTRYAWVWVNYFIFSPPTGDPYVGEIFRVQDSLHSSVEEQIGGMPFLTNVSYWGTIDEGKAIAGVLGDGLGDEADCCEGIQVYFYEPIEHMDICCPLWTPACVGKLPTGSAGMAVSYVSADKAYAVALQGDEVYDESAWSVSYDDGYIWNQLSLVDTLISYLSDVAVSPDCNKMFLVSVNNDTRYCGCDSVWLHASENLPEAPEYTGHWLRTWYGELLGDNSADFPYFSERGLLRLAPPVTGDPESEKGNTVYLVDRMTATIYYNNLETWNCWETRSSATEIDKIVDLAVKDEATIYALDDGGDVSMSDDYGKAITWEDAMDSEVTNGWTIAVWGNEILVGGRDGDVSHCADDSVWEDLTFTELEENPTISGLVSVAFDSFYNTNKIIYAATNDGGTSGGIDRWVTGESEKWEGTGAASYAYTGIVLGRNPGNSKSTATKGGVLYASYIGHRCSSPSENSCQDVSACWDKETNWYTGVARSLNPAESKVCLACVDWDYLTVGLTEYERFNMAPQALKLCGCKDDTTNTRLFAIDGRWYDMPEGQDGTVWTFEDCYAKKAPTVTVDANVPADPCSCYNAPFVITWEPLCDACYYELQFAKDKDFTQPTDDPEVLEPSEGNSFLVPGGENGPYLLACDTEYYVRMRAVRAGTCQEIHSWWSPAVKFTVDPSVVGGYSDITLISPVGTGVPIKNVGFTWSLLADADKFVWKLDDNSDLLSPLTGGTKTVTTTACTYTEMLAYGTTYYWQVEAFKGDSTEAFSSAVGTFTTAAQGDFCCPQCGLCFDTEQKLIDHCDAEHPAPDTQPWVWVVIGIGAVLVIVVIVLIFRTRRV